MQCYQIPSEPCPLLLPSECVGDVVVNPIIDSEPDSAPWMKGYSDWNGQRIPVISFSLLQNTKLQEDTEQAASLVVLNPITDAAQKRSTALVCYGEVSQVTVDTSLCYTGLPEGVDRRYVAASIMLNPEATVIVPKLLALSVAFGYM